ncbi:toxin-antitoxin system HicB family antitoxin [Nocardioides sp. dk4132]|uniref:toxin-antitoxin system HicB family antitoxin n=1 Tax=unclassified Nocardioides TaxID=2615069 RepID=UPI0012958161|nr:MULTISPECIES: toxin-antitoxin system HicB family antitoxin [unclassified Nocardioides]MQW77478.1 toxin-antitoxin system HicB family antitoxin [Nocardioides sp. dk4132]QGA09279.1 toxin-antitoxin system HicB family antitoxin [Nocardioides sp. dk884]
MDITPYVESLRRDLAAAAATGDEEVRRAAERLGHALDPAARLAIMEAVSQAASEITAEMPAGGVDVRLDGRELAFVVDSLPPAPPTPPTPPAPPAAGAGAEDEEEDSVARITLRMPESVKARAEELAARSGQSLNAWLVQAIRAATQEHAVNVDIDLSSIPFLGSDPLGLGRPGNRRMTGWL